ncbi:MAG: FliH/SctL family protein, partial [Steroidobacteraceae bacterium]
MSTLLRAEQVSSAEAWSAPQLEGAAATGRRPRTVREMQAAEEEVWDRVRDEARAEGLAAARAEMAPLVAHLEDQSRRLAALLDLQARPLARLDSEIEQQLAELSVAIARQLLRRELKVDPSQVIAVVRETVALLPASARDVRVIVHPEDAALIRERLVTPNEQVAWRMIEDPMLHRGDCRVVTDTAQIDARMENRLNAAIATLLGDERAQERLKQRDAAA